MPDVGYLPVNGEVTGFRVVDEQVWLTVGDKHYPADNVKQVQPARAQQSSERLYEIAGAALGRGVTWTLPNGKSASGLVTDVRMNDVGDVVLLAGGQTVSWGQVRRISSL